MNKDQKLALRSDEWLNESTFSRGNVAQFYATDETLDARPSTSCQEWRTGKVFTLYPSKERAEQVARLESFRSLARGWDTYDAEPPSEAALANALQILHVLWSFEDPPPIRAISPSVEGGVGIVFFGPAQRYADIECFNDGEILAITSEETAEPQVWKLETGSLNRAIERISSFLNG